MKQIPLALVASISGAVISLGGPVAAADLGRPAPAPASVVQVVETLPHRWTGFFVGGNIGGTWSDIEAQSGGSTVWSNSDTQFTGGLQMGLNYQLGQMVLGVEGGMNWASFDSGQQFTVAGVGTLDASTETNWIGTLTGRIGFVADQWLIYGKAGGAWINGSARVNNLTTGVISSSSDTVGGWIAGLGLEYAFSRNWSTRIEYSYIGLNDRTLSGSGVNIDNDIQMLTVGLNYKF